MIGAPLFRQENNKIIVLSGEIICETLRFTEALRFNLVGIEAFNQHLSLFICRLNYLSYAIIQSW